MAGTSALLTFQALSGIAGTGNALANAVGSYGKGQAEARLYRSDARMAEYQAEDAIRRGDYEASRVLADARRLAGQQRVGFAASGVKVDSGSAAQVVEDTATLGALDATMMKNNALREAFGYKTKAIDSRMAARLSRLTGNLQAGASVAAGIAGGIDTGLKLNALSNYYSGLSGVGAGAGYSQGVGAGVGR